MGQPSSEKAGEGGPATIGEHQSGPNSEVTAPLEQQEWQGSKLNDAVGLISYMTYITKKE